MNSGVVIGFVLLAAAGSLARFHISQWLNTGSMPFGTLAVNMVAALGAGLLTAALARPGELWSVVPDDVLATVVIGAALGSMSTYSTFAVEVASMARGGGWLHAAGYAGITVVLTVGAATVGLAAL